MLLGLVSCLYLWSIVLRLMSSLVYVSCLVYIYVLCLVSIIQKY